MANEELRLVAAAQRGDVESFNALVRLYEGRVYNLCYRLLGDVDSAADASQDAFLSAYRHLHAFRSGSFRSWVFRIATNVCYDALRARQRRPVVSLDVPSEESAPLQITDTSETPDEFVLRRELARAIEAGLAQLPVDQRLVVILCDLQGLTYEEIAEVTGTNLGTIKSRLSRGRARLRDVLSREELLPLRFRHKGEE